MNGLETTYYGQPMECMEVNTNDTKTLEYTYYGQPMVLTPQTQQGEPTAKNKIMMMI